VEVMAHAFELLRNRLLAEMKVRLCSMVAFLSLMLLWNKLKEAIEGVQRDGGA